MMGWLKGSIADYFTLVRRPEGAESRRGILDQLLTDTELAL